MLFAAGPTVAQTDDAAATLTACVALPFLPCEFDCGSDSTVILQVVGGGTGSASCGNASATCTGLQCTDTATNTGSADTGSCSVTQGIAICSGAG